jgi:hypothetical protein
MDTTKKRSIARIKYTKIPAAPPTTILITNITIMNNKKPRRKN